MSQLKVNSISDAAGSNGNAISLASDGTCTAKITNNLSNRNLIINGDCRIHQRGDYAAYDTNAIRQYGGVDRFHQYFYSGSEEARYTFKRATGPADKGFPYCAHINVTTADTSWHADHAVWTGYRVEANDCQGLYYGTSDAKDLTVSFWIKSKITGNFSLRICAEDYDDYYVTTYTVNSADTWEKKTITIPGDQRAGKGLTIDNSTGIEIQWIWISGTNRVGTPNQWATGSTEFGASGVTLANIFSSTSNYVEITAVQLEIGSHATDFEYKSYVNELARCQRYFYKIGDGVNRTGFATVVAHNSGAVYGVAHFPVTMRTTPALTKDGANSDYYVTGNSGNQDITGLATEGLNKDGVTYQVSGSFTQGYGYWFNNKTTAGTLSFSAEL